MPSYLVCGCKPWNRRVFDERISKLPGEWEYAGDEIALEEWLDLIEPRYIFFLHWSWMVPPEVYENHECVNFHMTNLPDGRGGSPLQNLLQRGKQSTVLTAHQMTGEVDAGPVYFKTALSLHGTAEEIYTRADDLAYQIIGYIIESEVEPKPQREPDSSDMAFTRRTPDESELPTAGTLAEVADHIRMLDAEGYPHAFLDWQKYRLEFRRAAQYDGRVEADVTIRERKDV